MSKLAKDIVDDIIKDLLDRRGIKQEIEGMDDDVLEEMKNDLAVIVNNRLTVDKAML